MTFAALFHSRWARPLPSLASLDAEPRRGGKIESRVRCSVVVAARDEEARIESTVRHLLAQRGVGVEVIVVDDRSANLTGVILHRLATEDTRVRVRRVEVRPDGWLGKCYACHVGAETATCD